MGRRSFEAKALKRGYPIVALVASLLVLAPLCVANADGGGSRQSPPIVTTHQLFVFHSGFWINLHHFLYEEAAVADAGPKAAAHEAELAADASISAGLSADEKKDWAAAVSYYGTQMISRDFLMNDSMRILKNRLEDLEGASTISGAHLDPALVAVLQKAAPIYRVHWWARHDQLNRAWIDAVAQMVEQHGGVLSQELATAYETPWPDHPIRVDVVAYANWAGSYTTLRPTRITISSVDAGNQNVAALEILFHEASHALIEKVADSLIRNFAAHKKSPPADLWHAIVFFTAGFFVEQLYPDYTPYADRFGLWTRGNWSSYRTLLVNDWQPRLEGRVTLDAALKKLAADVPGPPPR